MSETISDVVLRLARRHLPADAAVPVAPAQHDPESPALPLDPLAPLPHKNDEEPVHESARPAISNESSRLDVEPQIHEHIVTEATPQSSNRILSDPAFDSPPEPPSRIHEPRDQRPQNVVSVSNVSPRQTAGGTPAPQAAAVPQVSAAPQADESTWAPHDTESFADFEPRFEHSGMPLPPVQNQANRSRGLTASDENPFQSAARFEANASNSPVQPAVDTVNETSRQLEQTARDLENSLTRLFTTQIETLQRLCDRVDEQERRWVEQQAARRATL